MLNVPQTQAELAKLPDAALQKFAALHKADPYMMSLAMAESNRRKETRNAGQAQAGGGQPPKVVDQAVANMAPAASGIAQLPTPGVAAMAGGGIVAFAGGGAADDARLQELEGMYIPEAASGLFSERERLRQARDEAAQQGIQQENARLLRRAPAPVPAPPSAPMAQAAAPAGIAQLSAASGARTPGARVRTVPSATNIPNYPVESFEDRMAKMRTGAQGANEDTDKAFSPMEQLLNEERADVKGRKVTNQKEAILKAGLGMMAGTSPYAMVNIGKGGIEGLDAYQKAQAMDDAAQRANTRAQVLLAQAKQMERKGSMHEATAIYGQVRQEQQAAQQIAQKSEELKSTKEFQTRSLDIQQQQADQAGEYQRLRAAAMKTQDVATLKAQQSNIQAQLKADPTMQYTNPSAYQTLMQDYQAVNDALAKQPGGVTMGGTAAPSSAGWGKATVK